MRYFCDDHACMHLAAQLDKDTHGIDHADVEHADNYHEESSELDRESRSFFRELSASQLLDKSEIELRSYFRRLLSEAKRIQREIERRMIHSTELMGGIEERHKRNKLAADEVERLRMIQNDPVTAAEREAKQQAITIKKQAVISAHLAVLQAQAKLDNVDLTKLASMLGGKK
jgi:sugar-specific transcriptional regulator TrmB